MSSKTDKLSLLHGKNSYQSTHSRWESAVFRLILFAPTIHFRGVIEVLQRRLKIQIKKEKLSEANLEQEMVQNDNELHFYCVIDFEGTCEEANPTDYVHEIIEFPAVLVDANTMEVVSAIV